MLQDQDEVNTVGVSNTYDYLHLRDLPGRSGHSGYLKLFSRQSLREIARTKSRAPAQAVLSPD